MVFRAGLTVPEYLLSCTVRSSRDDVDYLNRYLQTLLLLIRALYQSINQSMIRFVFRQSRGQPEQNPSF